MHLRSLDRFNFDSVLLPLNYILMQDGGYSGGFERLRAVCKEKNVACQVIKTLARRPWENERSLATWYEPLQDQPDIDRAVSWALGSQPDIFLITASEVRLLEKILRAADQFDGDKVPADGEMQEMVKAREMSVIFDGSSTISAGKKS